MTAKNSKRTASMKPAKKEQVPTEDDIRKNIDIALQQMMTTLDVDIQKCDGLKAIMEMRNLYMSFWNVAPGDKLPTLSHVRAFVAHRERVLENLKKLIESLIHYDYLASDEIENVDPFKPVYCLKDSFESWDNVFLMLIGYEAVAPYAEQCFNYHRAIKEGLKEIEE